MSFSSIDAIFNGLSKTDLYTQGNYPRENNAKMTRTNLIKIAANSHHDKGQRALPSYFAFSKTYCQRGNRAKKRGCLGGRFIIPHDVGKTSQILRNPLKFAFLTIFGCK